MHVDQLIHARWIIPVKPENQVLEYHSLAITEGKIIAVLPTAEATEQFTAETITDCPTHALIPGLINAHTHSPMNLFKGLADDLPLMTWLNEHIWPAEKKWLSETFVKQGSRLAIAEMIRSGTTCFNDMYFFPKATAAVAADAGIRAAVGMILIDFPSAYAQNADAYLSCAIEFFDQYKTHPLIHPVFAPHAPYSVSDEPLVRLRTLAHELDLPIHMHLHETEDEINQSLQSHHARPLKRLQSLGMLTPNLVAVHMTQLNDDEIAQFAESAAHVVHCPESNLKLASGFCPVHKLLSAGINVALGTDGAASNNDLDMLGEMRTAALLGKGVAKNASALPAHQALEMATINGARALGIEHQTGSLEIGKFADIAAIDLYSVETSPLYHPISQIVYASARNQVTDVWVAGKQLLKNRVLTTLNMAEIIQTANQWQQKIDEKDLYLD